MPWKLERKHDHVAVVTMNTNKVNAQNPAFFADLHAAFDRLETEFDDCAVVLTGAGKVFSAGLDLDHHFAMFARRNLKEIDDWFAAYRATNLRLSPIPGRPSQRSTAMPMLAGSSQRLTATIGSRRKACCSFR
jgi:enoyl-CoA hydratase